MLRLSDLSHSKIPVLRLSGWGERTMWVSNERTLGKSKLPVAYR